MSTAATAPSRALAGMNLAELGEVAAAVGLRPFAAKQMAKWLYERRADSIDAMTDISLVARQRLKDEGYTIGRHEPKASYCSTDGTVKYVFDGVGGRSIEAVYIPDKERATLCVSSQAGCKMGCRFCMTGQGGWQGNLSAADIMNQILSIPESRSLTNIVFMGMGEPADNVDAVLRAVDILTAPWGLAWSPKRITVSSIGAQPGFGRILAETKVHIAVSLHTPFGRERADIMPVEKAFPIAGVVDELAKHDFEHQRRLSFEYTMFAGLNDDLAHADALARLIGRLPARVNLIRFHRTPGFEGAPSSQEVMERFRDRLNERGITATIRASRGEDITAACGMLAGKTDKEKI